MANEAVCIENPTQFARFNVDDATSFAKYTLLQIIKDPNYANYSSGADVFAGIAMFEKVANDGMTSMTAALDGVWDLTINANAGIALGSTCSLSGANLIKLAVEADYPAGKVIGKVLETGAASEVVRVRLGEY